MYRTYSKQLAVLVLIANFVLWSVPVYAQTAKASAQNIGIDIAGMNKSHNHGDDFFSYSNGGWYKTTEIPADRSSLGIFQGIAAEVSTRNAALITDAAKANTPEAKMVADYYAAYMDEKTIEARGIEPLKADLAA